MKFADLFKSMNVPYLCVVTELKPQVETKYGVKSFVKLSCEGADYEWFATPVSFQKNIVEKGLTVGSMVEITQVPSTGKWAQYEFKKVDDSKAKDLGINPKAVVAAGSMKDEMKDNKIAYQGILQALVTSGKYDIAACKELTKELVDWVFEQSKAKYDADHDVNHIGDAL